MAVIESASAKFYLDELKVIVTGTATGLNLVDVAPDPLSFVTLSLTQRRKLNLPPVANTKQSLHGTGANTFWSFRIEVNYSATAWLRDDDDGDDLDDTDPARLFLGAFITITITNDGIPLKQLQLQDTTPQ